MNTALPSAALLPSGLSDRIGPPAQAETALASRLIAHFTACGYQLVQPPLMEFAASILGEQEDSPLAPQTLRLMDPQSGNMLALRPDMTMQIARMAGSVLADAARPLRLCYGGQTLRALPDTMRQTRQFRQIGLELFGCDDAAGDVDILQTALSALAAEGLQNLTLDISLPQLLTELIEPIDAAQREALLGAIRHKDCGQITQMGQPLIAQLCAIAEPTEPALHKLAALPLSESARAMIAQAEQALTLLTHRLQGLKSLSITLDPLEMRGFGYHTGLSFAVYAPGQPQELGRGGRYRTSRGEAATGFTLYAEDILPLISPPNALPLLLLPETCGEADAALWRAKGYRTAYALSRDMQQEAHTLEASAYLENDLTTLIKVL